MINAYRRSIDPKILQLCYPPPSNQSKNHSWLMTTCKNIMDIENEIDSPKHYKLIKNSHLHTAAKLAVSLSTKCMCPSIRLLTQSFFFSKFSWIMNSHAYMIDNMCNF